MKIERTNKANTATDLTDGMVRQNIVVMSGIVTAPAVAAATSLEKAAALSLAFAVISMAAILLGSFVPQSLKLGKDGEAKISFTFRITVIAVIGAACYIPAALLVKLFFGGVADEIMLYIQLMPINSLVLSKTESRFYRLSRPVMAVDAFIFTTGFIVVTLITGIVREILSAGEIGGLSLGFNPHVETSKEAFFGFILIGLFAALCRWALNKTSGGAKTEK